VDISEVGQLFVTGISGLTLTEEEKEFLTTSNIGGVLLFKENYESPAQLAELTNSIQQCRKDYPLFVCVDQEGGRVRRFKTHFTQFPSMLELGQLDSPKLTFEVHKVIATELRACGVNLNLAPCCDTLLNEHNNVIGDRAFAKSASEVEKHVSAAIRGLHTGGVLACSKHFPGHGRTSKDSHYELPYLTISKDELENNELIPFNKASKSRVEFMMMSHMIVDCIDPDKPLTISAKAYKYLRESIKYDNIIISDDMEMKAIWDFCPMEKAAVEALKAGCDILEYRKMEDCRLAYQSVQEAIKVKELSHEQIEEKLIRIRDCKKRHLSDYKPVDITQISEFINTPEHQAVLDKIS
jgi:beta-N-acetylhexosaminidase